MPSPNPMDPRELKRHLHEFAERHGLLFQAHGECGFGRPCVGLLKHDKYVEYCPITDGPDYARVAAYNDVALALQSPPPALQEETPDFVSLTNHEQVERERALDELDAAATENAMPKEVNDCIGFALLGVVRETGTADERAIVWLESERTRLVEALTERDRRLATVIDERETYRRAWNRSDGQIAQLEQQLESSRKIGCGVPGPDFCCGDEGKPLCHSCSSQQGATQRENAALERSADSARRENEMRAKAQHLQFRVDELEQQLAQSRTETAALQKRVDRLKSAGNQLSTCAFNLAQPEVTLTPNHRASLKRCQQDWDGALAHD